jgi:D-glycero-D-manno-heptose 1,7-bisphosphate phosphatase
MTKTAPISQIPPEMPLGSDILSDPAISQRFAAPRRALFLDRDGVVIEQVHYIASLDDVRLGPGAAGLIRRANQAGFAVVVVTNQAGIAKGHFGVAEYEQVHGEMRRQLAAAGAHIDLTLAAPHHEEGEGRWFHPDHPCRKPNPGMLLVARERLNLDLAGSVIVGDRASDLEAGKRAGLAAGFGLATGYGTRERQKMATLAAPGFRVELLADLTEADGLLRQLSTSN